MEFHTIFTTDITFTGKHGEYIDRLKNANFSKDFFNTYIEIYPIAAIVGLIKNKTAKKDSSLEKNSNILFSQVSKYREKLMTAYHLVILLDKTTELSDEDRINRVLDIYPDKTEDEISEIHKNNLEIFNSYARGGLEILYDIMIEQVEKEKYNTEDSKIQAICNLAHAFIVYSQDYRDAPTDKVSEYNEKYDIDYI